MPYCALRCVANASSMTSSHHDNISGKTQTVRQATEPYLVKFFLQVGDVGTRHRVLPEGFGLKAVAVAGDGAAEHDIEQGED